MLTFNGFMLWERERYGKWPHSDEESANTSSHYQPIGEARGIVLRNYYRILQYTSVCLCVVTPSGYLCLPHRCFTDACHSTADDPLSHQESQSNAAPLQG